MRIGILGAGVAGLSAAYFLRDQLDAVDVFEADGSAGGLARSFLWHGFWCDIAPHRLYTTDQELLSDFHRLVPLHRLRRKSRIFIRGKWIQDPVNAGEILLKFFPRKSLEIVWGFLRRPALHEDNFESLVLNQYGKGLNQLFFRPYSEKLFGIPASEISPSWGQRKIRVAGIRDLVRRRSKLYFRRFWYPDSGGYGAITDRLYSEVAEAVQLNTSVAGIRPVDGGDGPALVCTLRQGDAVRQETYDAVVSTLPLPSLLQMLGERTPLRYRPAKLVYLLLDRPRMSPNHWIYFADQDFLLNRVAEFKHFAPQNAPARHTVVCCEITRLEEFSLERVVDELVRAGLIKRSDVLDSKIIDIPRAYPIYDLHYEDRIRAARRTLSEYPGLYLLGRQAEFAHQDVDEIFERAKLLVSGIRRDLVTRARSDVRIGAS